MDQTKLPIWTLFTQWLKEMYIFEVGTVYLIFVILWLTFQAASGRTELWDRGVPILITVSCKIIGLTQWSVLPLKIVSGNCRCSRTEVFRENFLRLEITTMSLWGNFICSAHVLAKLGHLTILVSFVGGEIIFK